MSTIRKLFFLIIHGSKFEQAPNESEYGFLLPPPMWITIKQTEQGRHSIYGVLGYKI